MEYETAYNGIAIVGEPIDLWQRWTEPELSMAYNLLPSIHPFLTAKQQRYNQCVHSESEARASIVSMFKTKEGRDADDV